MLKQDSDFRDTPHRENHLTPLAFSVRPTYIVTAGLRGSSGEHIPRGLIDLKGSCP
ncbi:MAG: hypothetical protein K0R27_1674 [Xanthobacteraceae bacterium]|jgi:predicted alpha/beta-fold hydrolase|nr:hypothetical protein [Xanthobacteraceae bacterium]